MGSRRLIATAVALVFLAGCGATPPQAPGPQAHQLNEALSAISTACGHATEIQEFTNDARAMTITEHQAQSNIPTLARIYKQNPDWIFQGRSVSDLVVMTKTFLNECGLHVAARRLQQATSG